MTAGMLLNIINTIYRTILARNTPGVWDLDEEVKDVNNEIMKFEALVGKSLWCVTYSEHMNLIATGSSDTSIKLWSITQHNSSADQSQDIIKYEYDLKNYLNDLPFNITKSEEYFFRSLCHMMVDDEFYIFASTNIGTVMQVNQ